MTKFKKIVSGTLAGCMAASALMGSAGAANVQTGTTPAPVAAPQNVRGTVTPSTTVKLDTQFFQSNRTVVGLFRLWLLEDSRHQYLQKQNDCKNPQGFSDRRTGMCPDVHSCWR